VTESLIGRIAGSPWVIQAAALQTIAELAERQIPDPANLEAWKGLLAPQNRQAVAFRSGPELPGARRAQIRDGVAIISVTGPIFRRANLLTNFSGATALSDIAHDFALARDDSRVRAIAMEFDTPGGHADGIAEVAAVIRTARGSKPIAAFVDGMAGSAGYWLASAADQIVVSPTAVVGSLGAVAIFPAERPGQPKALEIVSSQTPAKRANPHTDAGRAQLQTLIDRLADVFLADAAAGRGLSVEALLEATGGGGLVMGADAVAAGLADRVGGFEDMLARLAAGERAGPMPGVASGLGRAAPPVSQPMPKRIGANMTTNPETTTTPAAEAQASLPEASIQASAPPAPPPAATPADPVAGERARVSAILAAQKPGFGAMAQLAVNAGWTPETFAEAQDAAQPAVTAAVAAAGAGAFRASLPAPVQTGAAPAAPEVLTGDDKLKADFEASADLQAEFRGNFGAYAAWMKNAGKARRIAPAAA